MAQQEASLETLISKCREIKADYIVHEGFYHGNDPDTLHEHTPESFALYEKGLELHNFMDDNEDVMDAVLYATIDGEKTYFAEWWINGGTVYLKIA